jgi:hypothetical protein
MRWVRLARGVRDIANMSWLSLLTVSCRHSPLLNYTGILALGVGDALVCLALIVCFDHHVGSVGFYCGETYRKASVVTYYIQDTGRQCGIYPVHNYICMDLEVMWVDGRLFGAYFYFLPVHLRDS